MPDNTLLMTDVEFRAGLDREIEFLKKLVAESKPESIAPRLVVIGQQQAGKPHIIRVFAITGALDDDDQKHKMFEALGARCYTIEKILPLASYFVSEAWTSRQRSGSRHIQPSKDPARQEMVIVSARTIDGRDAMAMSQINRGSERGCERIIRLEKFETRFTQTQSFILKSFFDAFLRASLTDLKGKGLL